MAEMKAVWKARKKVFDLDLMLADLKGIAKVVYLADL
jgi:hypothetical protein